MRVYRLTLMLILIVSVLVAGAFILKTPGLKPVIVAFSGPPKVFAEQRIQDVGKVETDSKVDTEFLLYNKGGQHLRILDVQTTCGCTLADLSKEIIAPGDFTRVAVNLDTSIKLGPVRKRITIVSNDPDRPKVDLFLVGEVIPKAMAGHEPIDLKAEDPLVLFKGDCASCHVKQGVGKTGKSLFQADCAMCHGLNAQGHGSAGPSLLEGAWDNEAERQRLRRVIAEGSPRSPQMPPFSQKKGGPLTDDEIDSLVSFLQAQHLQNKLGLVKAAKEPEMDEVAFQEALKQPH